MGKYSASFRRLFRQSCRPLQVPQRANYQLHGTTLLYPSLHAMHL